MKTQLSFKLMLMGLLLAVSFAVVQAAGAQPGEFVRGVLQPLADGFPKKPITIIVVDDPGSVDDIYVKTLQAALKGVSPVNIVVVCEPSAVGGTWYTIKETSNRAGGDEGYYPIVFTSGIISDLLFDPGVREIGSKLEDLNIIIGTEFIGACVYQRKNAPWGRTFASMVKYAKENPGKLRYISKEVGSGADIAASELWRNLGLKVEKIPVGSHQEVASTVGGGEGDVGFGYLDVVVPNFQAGRIDVTVFMGNEVPELWRKDPNVVSARQAGIASPLAGNVFGLCTSSKVPQAHVDWLYKLFAHAATTDLYKNRVKVIPGIELKTISGAEFDKQDYLNRADPVVRAMGIHLDDLKK